MEHRNWKAGINPMCSSLISTKGWTKFVRSMAKKGSWLNNMLWPSQVSNWTLSTNQKREAQSHRDHCGNLGKLPHFKIYCGMFAGFRVSSFWSHGNIRHQLPSCLDPNKKKNAEANFYSSLKASGVMQCASSLKVLNSILEFIRYFDYRSDYVQ